VRTKKAAQEITGFGKNELSHSNWGNSILTEIGHKTQDIKKQ
jgi:hypothetical protein